MRYWQKTLGRETSHIPTKDMAYLSNDLIGYRQPEAISFYISSVLLCQPFSLSFRLTKYVLHPYVIIIVKIIKQKV